MISDKETNFVYMSDQLPQKFNHLYTGLLFYFDKYSLSYGLLDGTRDLWCVDYMPIQVQRNRYVQFSFNPDYYKGRKWQTKRTDPTTVTKSLSINIENSNIVLDGGNVVKGDNKAIVTNKIFKENPTFREGQLIKQLEELLRVQQVIVIPQEPGDFVGHADGMVRFLDDNSVLINHYPADDKRFAEFGINFRWALKNAGLEFYEMPYTSYKNSDSNDATGCYVNYLEVGTHLFVPAFGQHEDMFAMIRFQQLFSDKNIIDLDCSELAKEGGVLNCATWNIYDETFNRLNN